MKKISAWAITHPVFPLVLFAVLTVFGIVAFIRLPITLNPDVSAPFVEVAIVEPGAAPTEIETQMLQKVEGAVANVGNVKNITSVAIENLAHIFVEFQIGTPIDRAITDVRDAVAKVRSDLPQGILEPQVRRIDIDGGPIVYYAISANSMTEEQLSWFVDDTISKRLLAVQGVAQVNRSGGVNREIRVDLDPARMESFGITAGEVNQQLRQVNLDAAGGRAQVGGSEQSIRVLGSARTAEQLGDTRLTMVDGRVARLRDIAEVRDGVAEVRTISRLNGRPVDHLRGLQGQGLLGCRPRSMRCRRSSPRSPRKPPASRSSRCSRRSISRKQSYRSSIEALIEGAILAVAIVFLFLRDWRATGIAALAIPLSAIPTFAFMQWFGFTLNQMTPAGAVAGRRRAGRRCDRRDREHRAPHPDGQERLPGRDRRGRRDRPGGGRQLGDDHRGVPAGQLHGRAHRPVLQPVRPHGGGRGVHVAAGRAPDHAGDGGLHAQAARKPAQCRWPASWTWYLRTLQTGRSSIAGRP